MNSRFQGEIYVFLRFLSLLFRVATRQDFVWKLTILVSEQDDFLKAFYLFQLAHDFQKPKVCITRSTNTIYGKIYFLYTCKTIIQDFSRKV
jgi:hypothetical protein